MPYLDPKNDLTFKRVFGEHPHLCKSFLNSILPLADDEKIVELEYLSAELVPEIPVFKNTIVDVRCKDQKGRHFIVEMQMYWTESFKQRVLFNASKAYVRQLKKGEYYKILQPVYALSLVNDVFDKTDEFYHHYTITEIENRDECIEGLEFVFVELPKFKAETIEDKKMQVLWLRYFTEIKDGMRDVSEELKSSPEIKEALSYIDQGGYTEAELQAYDKYWDTVATEKTVKKDSLDRGRKEGVDETRKELLPIIEEERRQKEEECRLKEAAQRKVEVTQHEVEDERRQKEEAQCKVEETALK
ncbi:MAG: Rpn family recombination-promoting nuclease/putative transposase, partial [Candidatus Brocadiaceae bacterium]|nr:Rpn family recombination-promoting nuclease/putative transposase [Candidatus Brocadiaceae bacterium]